MRRKRRVILSRGSEEFWNDLVITRKCLRCGGQLAHDLDGASPVLACMKCGERYYKNYPKRTSDYELCTRCNQYFRQTNKTEYDQLCPTCKNVVAMFKRRKADRKKAKTKVLNLL
jgi:DNA-directed RNA polymerase subunit RPC12/RpoP